MPRSRTSIRGGLAAAAATLGLAATFALAAPAAAATTPTIVTPESRTGYGTIAITGTATPGATVTLWEAAFSEQPLAPADDFDNGGGPVTAVADPDGNYSITRYMDTGFVFAVQAEGLMSETKKVSMQILPFFWLTSPSAGVVQAHVEVSPMADKLAVQIQRESSADTWTTVASGRTNLDGLYVANLSGQPAGNNTYRASVAADPVNAVLANTSPSVIFWVAPTTPTTPTTPAQPAAGAVQFSKIQYDSAGRDSGTNASRNGEWFRLTNKTKSTINLKSWTVRDAAGHVYTFGSHVLAADRTVYVHTGSGTNGSPDTAHRYWGRSGYIWNNSGDTATLRTSTGKTIDSCKYTGTSKGYTNC
jgi:hypothetical protein